MSLSSAMMRTKLQKNKGESFASVSVFGYRGIFLSCWGEIVWNSVKN